MPIINQDKLKAVMRSNAIYDSEILSQCGYKKDTGFLENPTDKMLGDLKKYFERKVPTLNFDYLLDRSSNPNKYISLSNVKKLMKEKNVSITQLNNYIKEELKIDNGFYLLSTGMLPHNEDEAQSIIFYLDKVLDSNGNHTGVSEPPKKRAATVKDILKEEKVEETPNIKPDYRENKIDYKIFVQKCNSEGYSVGGFIDMVSPSSPDTCRKFLKGNIKSIPNKMVAAIQAALDCDIWYLEGTSRPGYGQKSQEHHFPVDDAKMYRIVSGYLNDFAVMKVMATNAGISVNILRRIRNGENIYFTAHTISRMFNQELLDVLKVKDLNEVIICKQGAPLPEMLKISTRKSNPITMPGEKPDLTRKKARKVAEKKEPDIVIQPPVLEEEPVEEIRFDKPAHRLTEEGIRLMERAPKYSFAELEAACDDHDDNDPVPGPASIVDVQNFIFSSTNRKQLDFIKKLVDNQIGRLDLLDSYND